MCEDKLRTGGGIVRLESVIEGDMSPVCIREVSGGRLLLREFTKQYLSLNKLHSWKSLRSGAWLKVAPKIAFRKSLVGLDAGDLEYLPRLPSGASPN
jgi:hypothetical protein